MLLDTPFPSNYEGKNCELHSYNIRPNFRIIFRQQVTLWQHVNAQSVIIRTLFVISCCQTSPHRERCQGGKKSHTTSILNFNSTRADQVEKCLPWRQQEGVGGWIRPLSNILYNIEQAHLVVRTKMV